jgi:hypothetical protein
MRDTPASEYIARLPGRAQQLLLWQRAVIGYQIFSVAALMLVLPAFMVLVLGLGRGGKDAMAAWMPAMCIAALAMGVLGFLAVRPWLDRYISVLRAEIGHNLLDAGLLRAVLADEHRVTLLRLCHPGFTLGLATSPRAHGSLADRLEMLTYSYEGCLRDLGQPPRRLDPWRVAGIAASALCLSALFGLFISLSAASANLQPQVPTVSYAWLAICMLGLGASVVCGIQTNLRRMLLRPAVMLALADALGKDGAAELGQ